MTNSQMPPRVWHIKEKRYRDLIAIDYRSKDVELIDVIDVTEGGSTYFLLVPFSDVIFEWPTTEVDKNNQVIYDGDEIRGDGQREWRGIVFMRPGGQWEIDVPEDASTYPLHGNVTNVIRTGHTIRTNPELLENEAK